MIDLTVTIFAIIWALDWVGFLYREASNPYFIEYDSGEYTGIEKTGAWLANVILNVVLSAFKGFMLALVTIVFIVLPLYLASPCIERTIVTASTILSGLVP